ncbi:MAG: hypothetical protein NT154_26920, partial [Verrucomicrobia bacterium]|nr:hypothetical protein [Verrucomicrobiota bacterium]
MYLTLPAVAGGRAVRLQLDFTVYGAGNVSVNAGLCYYWQTKAALGGTDWQFGLVDRFLAEKAGLPPQYLLLRPWAERQRPFYLTSSSADFCDFTTNLFFNNRAYVLDCRYDPQGDPAKYHVNLNEQTPRLGELKVSGSGLHRLILTAKRGMTVLLDKPQGTLKVPVGSYSLDEIWLRQGEVEVMRLKAGTVIVNEGRPASLVAGGPLTNSIGIRSQGDSLLLSYQLVG